MSVKSSTFGGVRLSGEEAEKFRRQVAYGKPKAAAHTAAERGRIMLKEFNTQGYVRIVPKER